MEGAELKFTAVLQGVQGQLGVTAITHLRHKLLEKKTPLSFQLGITTKSRMLWGYISCLLGMIGIKVMLMFMVIVNIMDSA